MRGFPLELTVLVSHRNEALLNRGTALGDSDLTAEVERGRDVEVLDPRLRDVGLREVERRGNLRSLHQDNILDERLQLCGRPLPDLVIDEGHSGSPYSL